MSGKMYVILSVSANLSARRIGRTSDCFRTLVKKSLINQNTKIIVFNESLLKCHWFSLSPWSHVFSLPLTEWFLDRLLYHYVHCSWRKSASLPIDCHTWDPGCLTSTKVYTKGCFCFYFPTSKTFFIVALEVC